MTREEAKDYIREWCPYDRQEEIIKALEQEPCEDATLKDIFCMGCEYKEQEPCDDAVNRRAVIQHICESKSCYKENCKGVLFNRCVDITWVNELPPARPNQWIPLKTKPMTDEESTFFRDWAEYGAELFDCPLPDDGQEVLVSWGGNVCIDTFVRDDRDGCYFEGVDIGDVEAWQPLPKPYESQEGSEKE